MTAALLCIGTELTRGELVNTNAAWLSSNLTDMGFNVIENTVVGDVREAISSALLRLSASAQILICTGGLGPTTDDITTEVVASTIGAKLIRDPSSYDFIRHRVEKAGRAMSKSNAKQADFPEGADILPNPIGTAPGFSVQIGQARAFFLPGVPREMRGLFENEVTPRIRTAAMNNMYQNRLRTFGLPESVLGDRLEGIETTFPNVIIGYRAHFPEVEVKILARAGSHAEAQEVCSRATDEVVKRLGDIIYGEGDDSFGGVVGRALRMRGRTLAIAESCTGGLVGHMLTREPGASEFMILDAVTYSNSSKTRLLGVSEDVIRGHGAVSPEVAAAMAEGARHVSGADYALSLTGIAGPAGGSAAKPVGTVFIALATSNGTTLREHHYNGDRQRIQTWASYAGLQLVREVCS